MSVLFLRSSKSNWEYNEDTVKFRKSAPGLIFFKDPFWGAYFWRGLYSEGLINGGKFAFQNQLGLYSCLYLEGNLRLKIDWASL